MVQSWYKETTSTWGDILDESVSRVPNKIFAKYKDSEITYKEFQESVNTVAKGLLKIGVQKGENIALWMGNRFEWIYVQFAIYKLGCALVPLYTRWARTEIEYALKQSDATTLIMEEKFLGKINALGLMKELIPEIEEISSKKIKTNRFPRLKRIIITGENCPKGAINYLDLLEGGKDTKLDGMLKEVQDSVDPFDVMNIMYTSGTTGFPKGGMSMHRNNLATVYLWGNERMRINEDDRLLNNFPLYSNFSCFVVYFTLLFKASMVLTEIFDPRETLRIIEEEKITSIFGSPPMFSMLLDLPDCKERELSSLRKGAVGGSSISPSLFSKIVTEMGVKDIISGYGLSEAGAASNTTYSEDPIEVRAGTVGIALPNFKVKIVDPKTGKDLSPGKQGEIWLHDVYTGSGLGKGYYRMPEKTRESFRKDGWFRSGDLGVMDENGYLKITGRLKDMALVGGFNVYPVEIENFLNTHPKIQQAFVLGVPDKRLGEVVMAYIVTREGEEVTEKEIIQFCKENIANYKIPKYIKFVTISEVPFSGHEKVQKYKLREQAIREHGLED